MARAARKIEDHVLAVLTGAVEAAGNRVVITQQLARADYVAVDKVLQAAGGAWNRKAKAHLFPADVDAAAVIDQLCLTGAYATAADDGWFPTPDRIADVIVDAAALRPGMTILEPSAGEGALITAALHAVSELHIVAVERDPVRQHVLAQLADRVEQSIIAAIEPCDFLSWTTALRFDRVIMNPPFIGTIHLDHVRHAFSMLKQGGRLAAILPAGVKFRQDRKHVDFRAWLVAETYQFTVDDLPDAAFTFTARNKPMTVTPVRSTGVRTVVITLEKP